MQEEFIELLKCPKSQMLFNNPVLSNGVVYEDQLCDDPDKISYVGLKSFIISFLDSFPNYKNLQYQPVPMKINSQTGKIALNSAINSQNFDVLYNYNSFSMNHISNDMLIKLVANASYEHIVYFIDNMVNIDEVIVTHNWKLINYICRFRPNDIDTLTYIIGKGANMANVCPQDNWYPLHQILETSTDENYIIFAINEHTKANLSLYVASANGSTIIGKIFRSANINIILHALTIIDKTQNEFVERIDPFIDCINTNTKLTEDDKELLIGEFFK